MADAEVLIYHEYLVEYFCNVHVLLNFFYPSIFLIRKENPQRLCVGLMQ